MSSGFWTGFPADPTDPANAGLRASDGDRDVIARALTEAFADGRLTREEHDDRSATLTASRTLGELPPLVADLVPSRGLAARGPTTPADVRARAVAAYERDRRDAVLGFLGPSLICSVIWLVADRGDLFWPAIVMAATLLNVLRKIVRREDDIAEHVRSIERRDAKDRAKAVTRELASEQGRELSPPSQDGWPTLPTANQHRPRTASGEDR